MKLGHGTANRKQKAGIINSRLYFSIYNHNGDEVILILSIILKSNFEGQAGMAYMKYR